MPEPRIPIEPDPTVPTQPKNPQSHPATATLTSFSLDAAGAQARTQQIIKPKNDPSMSDALADFTSPPAVFSLGIDYVSGQYHRVPASSGNFVWSAGARKVQAGGGKEPRAGVDPDNLAQAGWGVLFADKTAREALEPLLELRRRQAGARFAEYPFKPGQSARAFLNEQNAPPGPADPERAAPYYLTVVGDAEAIPFEFQQGLDVRYAVGRLAFDRPEDYASYAEAVVAAETGDLLRSRSAVYFGVEHPEDPVTHLCTERLVEPLASTAIALADWRAQLLTGASARHDKLIDLLKGASRPALLLAAGHGLVLPQDHQLQRSLQGALPTADWPGPRSGGVRPEQLFSADDLTSAFDVQGLICLLIGCFSAGTPRHDAFVEDRRKPLASAPFIAELPKRLLARGALACLGHVDSLFIHSYAWPGAGNLPQHQTFDDMLRYLMQGRRLGHAMDTFGRRYGELAGLLLSARLDPGQVSKEEYASYWIGYHDARQYIVCGDPAVRLAVNPASDD